MLTRAAALLLLVGLASPGIDQPAQTPRPAPPTWARDVAPIVFKNCVSCHWAHGVAPISLMRYDEVLPVATAIRDQVVRREMPPWLVDGPIGEFLNDTRMSDREIAIIAAWIDAGAPAGLARDLPEPPPFPTWQMGKPDVVLGLPKPYALPSGGPRVGRDFSLSLPLNEDKYVERVEVRPGRPLNTHHALVTVKDEPRTQVIGSYLPGGSLPLPAGIGKRIPKGASLTLSIHYDPEPDPDAETVIDGATTVGLKFATTPPQQIAFTGQSSSRAINLAPNTADIDVRGEPFVFADDSHILSLTPRMYRRGKQFTYTLVLPGGSSRVILKTTRWKDDWQPTYALKTPLAAPRGSRLVATGRFDNSSNHEYNPDPTQRIRYPREVMEGYFEFTVDARKPPR
jgi:hypothetical protein